MPFTVEALSSTDPANIIPLIVLIILFSILFIGIIGHHLGYDSIDTADGNPGLHELNKVFHQPDDDKSNSSRNSLLPLHHSTSHVPEPLDALEHKHPMHNHKTSGYIGQGHHGHRSKSLPKVFSKKNGKSGGGKYWDDHLTNLNTPQVISTLLGLSPQDRKIALESLTVLQASRIVTVVNEQLGKTDYWRPDLSDLLSSARVIPKRNNNMNTLHGKSSPNLHIHHNNEDAIKSRLTNKNINDHNEMNESQRAESLDKNALRLSSIEKERIKSVSLNDGMSRLTDSFDVQNNKPLRTIKEPSTPPPSHMSPSRLPKTTPKTTPSPSNDKKVPYKKVSSVSLEEDEDRAVEMVVTQGLSPSPPMRGREPRGSSL